MKEFVFFSNNKNKILEINNLFIDTPIKILDLRKFEKIKSPDETGLTFEENAKIKSLYGYTKFKRICFADDSGISISSLNGGPGVNSKEFLNQDNKPKENLEKIISASNSKNKFKAFFQTTISLSIDYDKNIFFTGKVFGEISKSIRGVGGFGYDPIFIPSGHKLTFAEMGIEKKNLISHRAIAIDKLKNYLLSI